MLINDYDGPGNLVWRTVSMRLMLISRNIRLAARECFVMIASRALHLHLYIPRTNIRVHFLLYSTPKLIHTPAIPDFLPPPLSHHFLQRQRQLQIYDHRSVIATFLCHVAALNGPSFDNTILTRSPALWRLRLSGQ